MKDGFDRLADIMQQRMKNVSQYTVGSNVAAKGTITSNLGLKLDDVSYTIPSGDYLICRSATMHIPAFSTSTTDSHNHTVSLENAGCGLKPGDRVVVLRCQSDVIVVDVLI